MMFTIPFRSMVLTMEAMTHEYAVGRQVAERYMLNELAAADREAFEEHFFSCHECAEDLRAVEAFAANARAVLAEELGARPLVATPPRETARARARDWFTSWTPSWWHMSAVPAFASAALLALVGYQSVVQIPALRATLERLEAPQALPTTVLRAATRGDATKVLVPNDAAFVQLAFDATPEQPVSEYLCEVRPDGGAPVFSLRLRAPEPGLPLNVLVPASLLIPGHYTMSLRAKATGQTPDNQRLIESYDFVVERQ